MSGQPPALLRSIARVLLLLLLLDMLAPAGSWGFDRMSHEAIGYIAESRLSPSARAAIRAITSGEDLPSISHWADEIAVDRPETRPWHYINLPVRGDVGPEEVWKYCPSGACVLAQVRNSARTLAQPKNSRRAKDEALRFLAHFIGDLHQPLHCGDDGDRGGNDKILRLGRNPSNLHAVWDQMASGRRKSARALASRLRAEITATQAAQWARGDEVAWCLESRELARRIYDELPPGPQDLSRSFKIGAYLGRMRPVAEAQLRKAGVRLGWLLNRLLNG